MKIIASLLFLGSTLLSARTWTDTQGRALEAELIRVEGETLIIKRNNSEIPIQLGTLSQADQNYVAQWRKAHTGDPSTAAADVVLNGKPIETGGKINLLEEPYSPETLSYLAKHKSESVGTGDWSPDSKKTADDRETSLKLAVAVPKDFNPRKPMNVFIVNTAVNSEKERAGGNIPKVSTYAPSCVQNGWVCLAIDSNDGVPMNFATYDQAFAMIEKSWPGFASSRFVSGGFSGGSKGCWGPLAWLVKTKRKAVGAFLGGCNEDMSLHFRKQLGTSVSGFRTIRVCLSVGRADKIATVAYAESVKNSLEANKVKTIREVFHDGGHAFYAAHFVEALKWWEEAP